MSTIMVMPHFERPATVVLQHGAEQTTQRSVAEAYAKASADDVIFVTQKHEEPSD